MRASGMRGDSRVALQVQRFRGAAIPRRSGFLGAAISS